MAAGASLEQVIERLVESPGPVPVVDEDGNYCGAISKTAVLTQLKGGQA
jgi:glycine betaine/proline transport system ATP-binding protein